MAEPSKQTPEERLREELLNVAAVVENLSVYCERSADLLGVVNLCLENDGMLKIILKVLSSNSFNTKR